MNRRGFTKTLALFGLAPLVKGKKVARIGDVFANWARGDKLNHPEIEQLRRTMNEMWGLTRQVSNLSDGSGLSADTFRNAKHPFSILPHETASLYMGTSSQAASSGWQTLTTWDATSGATWSYGLNVDSTIGRVYVRGIPKETVLLFVMSGYFVGSSVASEPQAIKYKANDGSERSVSRTPISSGSPLFLQLAHVRRVPTTDTYYDMLISCSSAIAGSSFAKGLFTVTRLR